MKREGVNLIFLTEKISQKFSFFLQKNRDQKKRNSFKLRSTWVKVGEQLVKRYSKLVANSNKVGYGLFVVEGSAFFELIVIVCENTPVLISCASR